MLLPALTALVGLGCLATSAVALYEHRLYTPAQREQASQLFRLRLFLWLTVFGIGLVSLGLLAVGDAGFIFEYGFLLGIFPLCIVVLERQLHRELDVDRSPLLQRFEDWWSHPSDR